MCEGKIPGASESEEAEHKEKKAKREKIVIFDSSISSRQVDSGQQRKAKRSFLI